MNAAEEAEEHRCHDERERLREAVAVALLLSDRLVGCFHPGALRSTFDATLRQRRL